MSAPHPTLFPITVIGEITLVHDGLPVELSPGAKSVLSALVAAGPGGIDGWELAEIVAPGIDLAKDGEQAQQRYQRAVARLRRRCGSELVPRGKDNRYRLAAPTDEVDVWWLLALGGQLPDDLDPARLRHVLDPAELYEGLDRVGRIENSRKDVAAARRDLVGMLVRDRQSLLTGALVPCLSGLHAAWPTNEAVIEALVRAVAAGGERVEALRVLHTAVAALPERGLEPRARLAELEVELLEPEDQAQRGSPKRADQGMGRAPAGVPDSLGQLGTDPLIGPPDALGVLAGGLPATGGDRWFLVTGPPSLGKKRLAAEAGRLAADRDLAVVHLAPVSRDRPWGPLSAALDLQHTVDELVSSGQSDSMLGLRFDAEARDALVALAGEGALALIVTDGQHLDRFSADFLRSLAHRSLPVPLVVVLTGDDRRSLQLPDDAPRTPWRELHDGLRLAGVPVTRVDLAPFDQQMMIDLVRQHRPDFSVPVAHQLAGRLVPAAEGLPGIALAYLAALDDQAMLLNSAALSPEDLLGDVIEHLSVPLSTVGAACAVLGPYFEFEDLQALLPDMERHDLLGAVDQLVWNRLVSEVAAPGAEFRVNILITEAFKRTVSQFRWREWHEFAARRFSADPHRVARHLRNSGAGPAAVEALLHSAELYLAEGLYFEAAADYRRASILLRPRTLEPADAGRFARALDLSGWRGNAERVRQEAFDRVVGDDAETALEIALSGQPEGERIDGSRRLVDNLWWITDQDLSRASRHRRACALARQAILLGRDDARHWVEAARATGETAAERVKAALMDRLAQSASNDPATRLEVLDAVAGDAAALPPEQHAEYLVHLAVDCYQAVLPDRLGEVVEQLRSVTAGRQPRPAWHARLVDSVLAFDQGDWPAAGELGREAARFGASLGIAEALPAELASRFAEYWLDDRLIELGGQISPEQLGQLGHWSTLAEAANAVVLWAIGRRDDAFARALNVAEEVLARQSLQASPALALLSPLLYERAPRKIVDQARDALSLRGSSMLLLGGFAATLGPAPRYVAALTPPGPERDRLRQSSIKVATAARAPAWVEITERDLATDRV